ncbi:methyl-accepting chemotaxis protein [Treponema zioleckii]|uniref:methyl-accepting chemotaxis protein n=1 Tax=Treponema zioleckii TaxID=331680 RepID=UPI00168C0248|nr:methyl-accepting chemotaxis protein [Treponema zioleckii]
MKKNFRRKLKKISTKFSITVGIEIMIMFGIFMVLSVNKIFKSSKDSVIVSLEALTKSFATNLNQRNSKFMQQMRMYTMSDIVRRHDFSTENAVEWLLNHQSIRSKDFKEIIYVDYETGMAYSDEGREFDVSSSEHFNRMKNDALSQYISNLEGTSEEDAVYWVCKSVSKNKQHVGYFAGSITYATLSAALAEKSLTEEGKMLLIGEDGRIQFYTDTNLTMKANALDSDRLGDTQGMTEMVQKMVQGETGFGWMKYKNGKDLLVYTPVNGTKWSLAFSVPYSYVFKTASEIKDYMIVFVSIIELILVGTLFIGVRRALKPLSNLEERIHEIASGTADLTARINVKTDDEVGSVTTGFNSFIEKLQVIMQGIKHSRQTLNTSEDNLGTGIEESNGSVSEIVSSLENVTEQLDKQTKCVNATASAVNEIASNIDSLERMIDRQVEGVNEASSAISGMFNTINDVTNSVESMAGSFDSLEELSRAGNEKQGEMNNRITQIEGQSAMLLQANKVIASIASQTNLLAMNAAIEAAHAGEAGRGFSVVADEIRKLSENSASQSRTIGEQLKKINDSINSVVKASDETSKMFSEVSEKIKETDEIVKNIKAAMESQKSGSVQINGVLSTMSDASEEVMRASKEMTNGNKAILDDVQRLKDATDQMNESVRTMSFCTTRMTDTDDKLKGIVKEMRASILKIGEQIDNFEV